VSTRNLADPDYEPTDDDFRELLASAATDARERHARAEALVRERVRAERVRLGLLPPNGAPPP
jgi:hypothetical protein